jgi:hypothetical protein
VKTEGRGRTVDEWKIRPQRFDNHWLDCLAGCAVAASMQGSALAEHLNFIPKKAKLRLSEVQSEPETAPVVSGFDRVEKKKIRLSDILAQKG